MKLNILILCVIVGVLEAKVFKACEFAKLAKESGLNEVGKWTCIAFRESRFNSKARNSDLYGILQISGEDWCGRGRKCGITCDSLLDSNLTDDLLCAKRIYNYRAGRSGKSGFTSWSSSRYCKGNQTNWIAKCNI